MSLESNLLLSYQILQITNSCVLVTKDNKITGIVNCWDYFSSRDLVIFSSNSSIDI